MELSPREAPTTASAPAGLSNAEASLRLERYGPNAVPERRPHLARQIAGRFWGPVPWMLEAAAMLELVRGERLPALVIVSLLAFNATLGLMRERRASKALAALKQGLAPTAHVCREGIWSRIDASSLVPGDLVRLSLGAIVPADVRVVSGAVLVDQSSLTGESLPVDKGTGESTFAGALVARGQALAEVTATGSRTFYGRAIELVARTQEKSSEELAVLSATRRLALINGVVAAIALAYSVATHISVSSTLDLALTILLASIPVALPATFTLAGAIAALRLASQGVLLTRLSAAHEAAALDTLCTDKTGTLTRNALQVARIVPAPGVESLHVLRMAATASSESDADSIDATLRQAYFESAADQALPVIQRFVPFDPGTKTSEAEYLDPGGSAQRALKGALSALEASIAVPAEIRAQAEILAAAGHRILGVAAGPARSPRLIGVIALNDPPREDAAAMIRNLGTAGIRTVMLTGDAAGTAEAIARQVGITGRCCSVEHLAEDVNRLDCGVFARVLPEDKLAIVRTLQHGGHVVGMCGDGTNDAPALRQAQLGIAVSTATDAAKAAAGMVLTQPGLRGVLAAVTEGRKAFQRVQTFALNMMTKKIEVVLFLACGPILFHHAILTPTLMVVMMVTNDFLSMSLTTDRVIAGDRPSQWNMRGIASSAAALALVKLSFTLGIVAIAAVASQLDPSQLQTLAFVTLVFGNQALLLVVRSGKSLWTHRPGSWVAMACLFDIAIALALASTGTLMAPIPSAVLAFALAASAGLAVALDLIKRPVYRRYGVSTVDPRGDPHVS